MSFTARIAAPVLAVALALGGATSAMAKAHDQGRADGTFNPDAERGARDRIDFLTNAGVLDGHGVSFIFNNGQRGDRASARKGDNRVVPVVSNQPD